MDVIHCPSCGSNSIDVNSFSAEYMSSTTYDCEDCEWKYSDGRGMGVGSGNSGVHPRKVGRTGQHTLTETGDWCGTCNTCAKPGYCQCVEDDQTGFCESCAKYSDHDVEEMHEVETYFGRHSTFEGFTCSICENRKAELKIVEDV